MSERLRALSQRVQEYERNRREILRQQNEAANQLFEAVLALLVRLTADYGPFAVSVGFCKTNRRVWVNVTGAADGQNTATVLSASVLSGNCPRIDIAGSARHSATCAYQGTPDDLFEAAQTLVENRVRQWWGLS